MSRHRLSASHRFLLIFVLFVVRHPIRTLIGAAMLLLGCGLLASWRLDVSTDQDKLFSSNVPFFRDYLSFVADFPENQANYVLVEPREADAVPPVQRWVGVADAITARLGAAKDAVAEVDSHVPLLSLGNQGLLYEDRGRLAGDLDEAKQLIPLARLWGEKPRGLEGLLGQTPLERFIAGLGLQNPPDVRGAQLVDLLADGWRKVISQPSAPVRVGEAVPDLSRLGASDPSRLGYYYVVDQEDVLAGKPNPRHLLLVRVFQKNSFGSLHGLEEAINTIRTTAADAARAYPEFDVTLTGRPALEADEMATTDTDSRRSEILALSAVFVGLVVLLRSVWLAITAEIALLVGIGWTFGWATISSAAYMRWVLKLDTWRGELNLLSAVFLIALIGIGMDYLIQVLTRYRREAARHGERAREARVVWIGVFKYVAAPINTACLGAAGAFLVSVFTHFRGAAELGIIAGGGLLLCLASGYTVLPALLTLWPAKVKPWPASKSITTYHPRRHYHRWLVLPAVWAVLLAIGIPFALRARFDPGLINMQAPNLASVKSVNKLQLWFDVELDKDPAVLRRVRNAVQRLGVVGSTESILDAYDNYDWLKVHGGELGTVAWAEAPAIVANELPTIRSKAMALARRYRGEETSGANSGVKAGEISTAATAARDFAGAADALDRFVGALPIEVHSDAAARAAERLTAWQSGFVAELKNLVDQFHPGEPDPQLMPTALRQHLVGKDGRLALYVYPPGRDDLWQQANLERFVNGVEPIVAAVRGAPPITGIASDIYHSTSSIHTSFFHATAYALSLIFLLVLIDLRNLRQTLLAISVLAMGLPVLVALMGLFHISWNFANFFGLPILIGAGHEYGVFMVHRYNEACRDSRRAWQAWDVSDRALLACAYVTTASFGFFALLAHHRGLRSLGLVMAMGTVCIYLATLCMLRPLLLWNLSRAAARIESECGMHAKCKMQNAE